MWLWQLKCNMTKSARTQKAIGSLEVSFKKGGGYVRRLPHALHLVLGTTHPKISWELGECSFISSRSWLSRFTKMSSCFLNILHHIFVWKSNAPMREWRMVAWQWFRELLKRFLGFRWIGKSKCQAHSASRSLCEQEPSKVDQAKPGYVEI